METSAKASINVETSFFTLARDIKAKMDRKLVWFSVLENCVFAYCGCLPSLQIGTFDFAILPDQISCMERHLS